MAGFGGSLGYAIGAIDWSSSLSNNSFSAHVRTVFAMITVAFIACVTLTVTSFPEVPLNEVRSMQLDEDDSDKYALGSTNVNLCNLSTFYHKLLTLYKL